MSEMVRALLSKDLADIVFRLERLEREIVSMRGPIVCQTYGDSNGGVRFEILPSVESEDMRRELIDEGQSFNSASNLRISQLEEKFRSEWQG